MDRTIYLVGLTDPQTTAIRDAASIISARAVSVAGPGEVPTSTDTTEKIAFVPYFGPETFGATIENLARRGVGGCVGIIPSASFQACADAFRAGAEDVIADPVHADDVSRCLGFLANGGLRRMEPMQVRPLQELERDAIVAALAACRGQVSLTARRLGIGRSTLYRKLEHFGLNDVRQ